MEVSKKIFLCSQISEVNIFFTHWKLALRQRDRLAWVKILIVLFGTYFDPYPAKLIYLNFHPLEVVSRFTWLKITHICLI